MCRYTYRYPQILYRYSTCYMMYPADIPTHTRHYSADTPQIPHRCTYRYPQIHLYIPRRYTYRYSYPQIPHRYTYRYPQITYRYPPDTPTDTLQIHIPIPHRYTYRYPQIHLQIPADKPTDTRRYSACTLHIYCRYTRRYPADTPTYTPHILHIYPQILADTLQIHLQLPADTP
jgi:hypothetical protein